MRRSWGGFTLVELSVVITLVVLFLGVTAYSIRGPYRRAEFTHAIDRVKNFDSQIRQLASRKRWPVELVYDCDRHRITATSLVENRPLNRSFRLPGQVKFERVVTRKGPVSHGDVNIPLTASGQSPTYAIGLSNAAGQQQTLLFFGVTGQVLETKDEEQIKRTFRSLRADGTDPY